MKALATLLLFLIMVVTNSMAGPETLGKFISMDVETGLFVDSTTGRQLIFHGVNICPKLPPYLPTNDTNLITGFSNEDMLNLKSWGMNMIRLCVMWEAVMPIEGYINTTYLGAVHRLVDLLYEEYGIYTLIDAHQDTLNGHLCGEGIPDWVFNKALNLMGFDTNNTKIKFPAPLPIEIPNDPETGMPLLEACVNHTFFSYYLTFESEAAWKALYTLDEIKNDFKKSWVAVANEFRNCSGILGYELLNEPWADITNHPFSDKETLLGLYTDLAAGIRSVDKDHTIFFEPIAVDSYFGVINVTTDFPTGGIPLVNVNKSSIDFATETAVNQVFTYHIYWPPQESQITPLEEEEIKIFIENAWDGQFSNLKSVQLGGFMSEFGAVGDDIMSVRLIDIMLSEAASRKQGWAYWTYKSYNDITTQNSHTETFFNADGSLQLLKVKILANPYPVATAGHMERWTFDQDRQFKSNGSGVFNLIYLVDHDKYNNASQITHIHVGVIGMHCNGNTTVEEHNSFNTTLASTLRFASCILKVVPSSAVSSFFLGISSEVSEQIIASVTHKTDYQGNISVTILGI